MGLAEIKERRRLRALQRKKRIITAVIVITTGILCFTGKVFFIKKYCPSQNSTALLLGIPIRNSRSEAPAPTKAPLAASDSHTPAKAPWAAASDSHAARNASPSDADTADTTSLAQAQLETQVPEDPALTELLKSAREAAYVYDYDRAVELLSQSPDYQNAPSVVSALQEYETAKSTLVKADINQITHVFFHSLVIDTSKAFDGDRKEKGYNQVMTTKDEFLKMMQSMYDRGYVLVRLHDIGYEQTAEDGSVHFVPGEIWLPEGKKPFVLSQDDVCYYEYMDGDGFASRMVIGEDGLPACEMKQDDGTTVTGDYDLVPILENFIREHPGFSYRGARGVIAFTGYNGILGYRTAASYSASPTYEADRQAASQVAQCLRDAGWELASHSWGHKNMGAISYNTFKEDTDKWETEVESLIGPTDIILFPFGSDIGDWHPYSEDNPKFQYLKSVGFRYFCNVDSRQYWVQMGNDHLRQGRRNLDGYRMYYDMINPDSHKLDDLFDVSQVFDPARPVPVAPMGG